MKRLILVLCLIVTIKVNAQYDIAAGMGISFINNSSLQDYINSTLSGDEVSTFNSAFEVFLETDVSLTPKFQMGFEYVYSLFSHNAPLGGIGQYDITYAHHKPSVLAYYVIPGRGYKFKFGAGAGYRYVDLDEKILASVNYTSSGFGLLARVQAHTALSSSFFANIGTTLRYDLAGEVANNGNKIYNKFFEENVNINSLSISINLGVSYFIGN
ncbi:MAG: hypothetical protein JW995_07150 [Melioribacteraceae bacterium]|nr:hypothetical protein [Melioribacteraceae bacterium]